MLIWMYSGKPVVLDLFSFLEVGYILQNQNWSISF